MKASYFKSLERWFLGQEREPVTKCILCGEIVFPDKDKTEGPYSIVTCPNCEFVWQWHPPTQAVLDDFYSDSGPIKQWSAIKSTAEEDARQSKKFDFFNIIAGKGQSVLDVGCGNGHFLNGLDSSIIKIGIEQSKAAAEHCKFSVYNDLKHLTGSLHGKRKYNIITFFGVLEHLKDPIGELQKYSELLEDDGSIGVIVPNMDSLVVRVLEDECCTFCPQHLWYYNITTLNKLMANAGYVLRHWGTREPELQPVLRKLRGLKPYDYMFDLSDKDITEEKIIKHGLGYKIVALFKKGGATCPNKI